MSSEPVIHVRRTPTEYLYGVYAVHFIDMKYKEVLVEKIYLAREHVKSLNLLQSNSSNKEDYLEYEDWINDVYKAIEYNRNLLEEINEEINDKGIL